jgi:hypothetical protein
MFDKKISNGKHHISCEAEKTAVNLPFVTWGVLRRRQSYLKHSHTVTSGDALRPERLVRSGV